MTTFAGQDRWELHLKDHASLARELEARGELIDFLATDTPYSDRTHAGHNALLLEGRRAVGYRPWTQEDVEAFVRLWSPLTLGWFATITDHVLAPHWERCLLRAGRYVFPPVPLVVTGSRIRMRGDGPSPWTYQIVLARPRTEPWSSWGTRRGAYVGPRERLHMAGGKPLWAMRALVADYARPGHVVCDPCCGAGTTQVAALLAGCRSVGGDSSAVAVGIAAERLQRLSTRVDASEVVDGAPAEDADAP